LNFTITKYGDNQIHGFIRLIDPQNLGKDTKIISLARFIEELWMNFYDMAATLNAILNFILSAREPDCPPKFFLLI